MARPRKHEYGKATSRLAASRAALVAAGGKIVSVSLQPQTVQALETLAARDKQTATEIINRLIQDAANGKT